MKSDPRSRVKIEAQIDELCDEFECEVSQSTEPDLGRYLSRVPIELAERLCVEILSIFEELNGSARLKSYSEAQRILHPEFADAIQSGNRSAISKGFIDSETRDLEVPTTNLKGPLIDRYKLLHVIGEGGMGSVWMAVESGIELEGNVVSQIATQRPELIEALLERVEEQIETKSFATANALLAVIGKVDDSTDRRIERLKKTASELE